MKKLHLKSKSHQQALHATGSQKAPAQAWARPVVVKVHSAGCAAFARTSNSSRDKLGGLQPPKPLTAAYTHAPHTAQNMHLGINQPPASLGVVCNMHASSSTSSSTQQVADAPSTSVITKHGVTSRMPLRVAPHDCHADVATLSTSAQQPPTPFAGTPLVTHHQPRPHDCITQIPRHTPDELNPMWLRSPTLIQACLVRIGYTWPAPRQKP